MKKERGVILAGNWKMNHTQAQTLSFFSELQKLYQENLSQSQNELLKSKKVQAYIYPSFLSLEGAVKAALKLPGMVIGSQNTNWKESGAFTGEVSTAQLKEIGVQASLVGHSERREFFGESNATVEKRTRFLIEQGFQVMVCVGETLAEREAGKTFEVLKEQLKLVKSLNTVIAYEPVWAIGTGKTATPAQAEEVHLFIRDYLSTEVSKEKAQNTVILYGGSVKPENFKELLQCPNIDGALVGGASLKSSDYFQMLLSALSFF